MHTRTHNTHTCMHTQSAYTHTTHTQTLAGFEVDANDFHEKMELCDVCGSFLVIGDSQSRVDAHLLGKQHMGYARIRAAIAELKVMLCSAFLPY